MPHFYLGNFIFNILSILDNAFDFSTLKKSHLLLPLTTLLSGALMAGFLVAGSAIILFSRELPDAEGIRGVELKVPLRVFSADNLLISEFGNERRKPLDFQETPQALIDSVLASEDDGFFEHRGIDIKGLIRAAISNFQTGKSGQGASTITMQVARNFFLSRDKTYARKLKEVLLAIRLEEILTKQEILSLYLNKIFLGHRAYGFGAAAEVYYGKELDDLSSAQIAMLAGLPKAPSSYNPIRNPKRAKQRRNYVLGRLLALDKISNEAYETAIAEPVTAKKHGKASGLVAPHIAEMVRAQLTEQYGEDAYWQGLNVYTTVLSTQQIAAEQALRKGLRAYDRRHGFRGAIGRVDLTKLKPEQDPEQDNVAVGTREGEDQEPLSSAYERVLSDYPGSQEQRPALVLSSLENVAELWESENGRLTISFEASKWAKRHKTANLVGDAPKGLNEILQAGDIIYVEPKPTNPKEKEPKEKESEEKESEGSHEWQLSQIPAVSGAIISMEPDNGKILSLIGGYDFFLNKYNRAVQSIRQPGSNIKPFIYSASLDKGFTPASLISGAPIVMTDPAHGTVWRPENYSGKFFGPTRMRIALGKSMNLVSIRLLRAIGIPFARDYVQRFGIDMDRFSATLTMALGSGGVTPLEMLSAYSALANGGYRIKPYFIERITDRDGVTIFQAPQPELCDKCYADFLPKPEPLEGEGTEEEDELDSQNQATQNNSLEEPETLAAQLPTLSYEAPRVMTHANNFLTVSMMKDVVRRGTAKKALALNRQDLAGKTGTTNDYVDAWFTGFNSKVATTVWVGFDNPTTMGRGEAGSRTALPIWVDYMKTGLQGVPEDSSKLPDYIQEGFVDRNTGRQTDELDPSATPEYFVINELTPEYEMLQQQQLDQGLEDSETGIDEALDSNLESDQNPVNKQVEQQDRIIDEQEDTEGLF